MANTVRILVTAKDEVSGTFDRIQDKATLLSKTDIGKGMVTGAGIAAFGALQTAALGALDSVMDFATGSVAAAKDEQAGIARLNASLEANVAGWDGNTEAIDRNLRKMMMASGFADDDIRESLSRLVGSTHDVGKAWDLMGTAADLARKKGISLADASTALIKVEGGQYRALKELGIVLDKGATSTEALAAVQKVAGGQMAAYMNEAAGKTELLSNRLGDLQETLGEKVTPALVDGTEKVLGLMDALDSEAPIENKDRILGVVDALSFLNPLMQAGADEMNRVNDSLEAQGAAAAEAAMSWDTYSEGAGAARESSRKLAGASGNLGGAIGDVGDEASDAAGELKKLKKSADDALDAFLEATLGPEELKLELRNSKDELGENQREAEKLEEKITRLKNAGKPVGELQDDLADLRLEIVKNKEDVIRATARLEDMGEVPMGSTKSAIERLIGPLNRVEQQAWDAYDALRAVLDAPGGRTQGGSWGNGRGKDAGGFIAPYGSALVNEGVNGTEAIFQTGSSGAYVNPSMSAAMAGSGGGGSPIVIQLMADRRVLAELVAPGVTAWQQQSNILPRR